MTDDRLEQHEPARDAADPWERAGELLDVSFPGRLVEVVVIPYGKAAAVMWQDRRVSETIAPGAFDGIQRRANRVRANRDHKDERAVGRAVTFHPNRAEGLVAEVRIAQTPLGDETLTLCADGVLDASAGFRPADDGLHWDSPTAYTITKAWLHHIAFTPNPAFEDARVLAVRSGALPAQTFPARDEMRAWLSARAGATVPLA